MQFQKINKGTIYQGDNLDILQGFNDNSIDLIYLDPPFNKKKQFTAPIGSDAEGAEFKDYWVESDIKLAQIALLKEKDENLFNFLELSQYIGDISNKYYLTYMAVRLIEMKRILKDTGSIYLHCDNTMGHYLKLLMDVIFGHKNFRNEIVWYYRRWTATSNRLQKLHDTIFWYTQKNQYYFDQPFIISSNEQKGVKESWILDEESQKYFRWQSLKGERYKIWKNEQGVKSGDVWDIPFLHPSAKERIGYPTQKPLALLERIIKASCPEGGIVLDPFCGCATTCVAAEKLEREWVGIDISKKAYEVSIKRLSEN